jgi:hypothetical protein
MHDNRLTPPFSVLYTVTYGDTTRTYSQLGIARAQVTRAVDQRGGAKQGTFTMPVRFWRVSQAGWELLFSAEAGDSHETIPWANTVERNEQAKALYRAKREREEEASARAAYEELRTRFEGA